MLKIEENIARLLKNAIGDSFHSFIIAKDGKEGLEKFIKISPDIVITDINMSPPYRFRDGRRAKKTKP